MRFRSLLNDRHSSPPAATAQHAAKRPRSFQLCPQVSRTGFGLM